MITTVEAPFAFFEEKKEAFFGDTVEPSEMALGLVPEILDPVDVVVLIGEQLRVVDAGVMKARHVKRVIAPEAVRVDDAVGQDHALHDGQKRVGAGVGYHHRVDPASTLEQPENRDFPGCPAPSLALSDAAKVALVDFNLSRQRGGLFQLLANDFPQPSEEGRGGIAMNTNQFSRCPSCRAGNEVLNESGLLAGAEPAFPGVHGAILRLNVALS